MLKKWLRYLRNHYFTSLFITIGIACVSGGLIEAFYGHETIQAILWGILLLSLAMVVVKAVIYHFL